MTWETVTVEALRQLGGSAHLGELNARVRQIRDAQGLALSATWPATVRRTCQQSKHIVQDRYRSGVWRLVNG